MTQPIHTPTPHHNMRGMTLVELLVAIAIIMMIMPILYAAIQTLYDIHSRTFARSLALAGTTGALKEVVRDVRGAVYSESGALPLVTIGTSTLTLYSDTDIDGEVEKVRYTLVGETLQKGTIEPTATSSYPAGNEVVKDIAFHITNNTTNTPIFQYLTATSTEITSQTQILDVRRITATLNAEVRVGHEAGAISLSSSASIRNLKDTY